MKMRSYFRRKPVPRGRTCWRGHDGWVRRTSGSWYCWECQLQRARKQQRLLSPAQKLYAKAKHRAKRRGTPFTITVDFVQSLLDTRVCAYDPRHKVEPNAALFRTTATLDEVMPGLGYTPTNTVLACWTCNRLKSNWTLPGIKVFVARWEHIAEHPLMGGD